MGRKSYEWNVFSRNELLTACRCFCLYLNCFFQSSSLSLPTQFRMEFSFQTYLRVYILINADIERWSSYPPDPSPRRVSVHLSIYSDACTQTENVRGRWIVYVRPIIDFWSSYPVPDVPSNGPFVVGYPKTKPFNLITNAYGLLFTSI